jgi:hypothetical protein
VHSGTSHRMQQVMNSQSVVMEKEVGDRENQGMQVAKSERSQSEAEKLPCPWFLNETQFPMTQGSLSSFVEADDLVAHPCCRVHESGSLTLQSPCPGSCTGLNNGLSLVPLRLNLKKILHPLAACTWKLQVRCTCVDIQVQCTDISDLGRPCLLAMDLFNSHSLANCLGRHAHSQKLFLYQQRPLLNHTNRYL